MLALPFPISSPPSTMAGAKAGRIYPQTDLGGLEYEKQSREALIREDFPEWAQKIAAEAITHFTTGS